MELDNNSKLLFNIKLYWLSKIKFDLNIIKSKFCVPLGNIYVSSKKWIFNITIILYWNIKKFSNISLASERLLVGVALVERIF
jgi:hypothetical protein